MKTKKVTSNAGIDIIELAHHLRQEYLYVNQEKQQLQKLNEKVLHSSTNLFHLAWISRQQRINLDRLLLSHSSTDMLECCLTSNALDVVNFVDAYKKLGVHEMHVCELLSALRKSPLLLAKCLMVGEQKCSEMIPQVCNTIMSTIYGHCILHEDKIYVLQVLKDILVSQLAQSDNPRRLIRHQSCAFSRIYRIFSEQLIDAKLFLTSALHDGVIQLLSEDDLFLDIDPNKAVVRFEPQERVRHFGQEGTQEYADNLHKYKIWTIKRLGTAAMKFIEGIQQNMFCFPQSLAWIVRQLYTNVVQAKKIELREIGTMCVDLIFGYFICSAIVNPDLYGITEAHISHIARYNLTQVAQIIQVLAMSKWEDIDPKLSDLYGKFEKDCLSKVIDYILERNGDDFPRDNHHFGDIARTCALISENELKMLIEYLKNIKSDVSEEFKPMFTELIDRIPDQMLIEDHGEKSKQGQSGKHLSVGSTNSNSNTPGERSTSPRMRKSILNRVTSKKSKSNELSKENSPGNKSLTCKEVCPQITDVLKIPFSGNREVNLIGMLSEDNVLKLEQHKRQTKVRLNLEMLAAQSNEETESFTSAVSMSGCEAGSTEKRTRFSLSQDQESVGTSDNLEAISEAASNHSEGSSLDMENENDNMSDMLSANVSSGRATPNISGRDTPSSSHTPNQSHPASDEEQDSVSANRGLKNHANLSSPNCRVLNSIPVTQPNRPNNRDDIEEKFGKFDIKPIVTGDETKSMISDTWSTDVLASDSEAFEQSDVASAAVASFAQASGMNLFALPGHYPSLQALLDNSETLSQSDAWSTDVLASDTERMQEFDDSMSVTRSDDISMTRSETDEDNLTANYMEVSDADNQSPKIGTIKHKGSGKTSGQIGTTSKPSEILQDSGETIVSETQNEANDGKVDNSSQINAAINDLERNSYAFSPENRDSTSSSSFTPLSSTNMQSLGRLSFDLRRFDENSVKLISDSTVVGFNLNNNILNNNQTNVNDLFSTNFLNNDSEQQTSSNTKSVNTLIDLDMEVSDQQKSAPSNSNDLSLIVESNDLLTNDPKPPNSGSFPDQRFSFSSLSTNSSTNEQIIQSSGEDSKQTRDQINRTLAFTGAIPKAPNYNHNNKERSPFDESLHGHSSHHRKGFFKLSNIKSTFKDKMRSFNQPRKGTFFPGDAGSSSSATLVENSYRSSLSEQDRMDTTDEILEKYRAKSNVQPLISTNATDDSKSTGAFNGNSGVTTTANEEEMNSEIDESEIFNKTKRKIRKVLSSIDVLTFPELEETMLKREIELNKLLKVLLSEAVNLRNSNNVVLLHEALRSIQTLDENGCQKLFWSLREDYQRRVTYIAYLTRSRQQLLSTLAFFNSLTEHVEQDKSICAYNLVSISVRQFLEKMEKNVQVFVKKFQSLVVADEKIQLVDKFLTFLFDALENDSSWQASSGDQMDLARRVIERHIMSQIYILALYPNGDGDVFRDQILFQHIHTLSNIISTSHKDLVIPKMYHSECPWPSAQADISALGAHKTPRDKIKCVVKCCNTIMNLLSLATDASVPAADDLMPVLVFVLIKANPISLLSTVQYVNSFYEKHFQGEEAYWWTQFCSAVEFIKTME